MPPKGWRKNDATTDEPPRYKKGFLKLVSLELALPLSEITEEQILGCIANWRKEKDTWTLNEMMSREE
jgi:hypothetical protein